MAVLSEQIEIDTTTGISTLKFLAGGVVRATFTYTKATGQVTLGAGEATTLTLPEMALRLTAFQAWRKKTLMMMGWQNGGYRVMTMELVTTTSETKIEMKVAGVTVLELIYDRTTQVVTVPARVERLVHGDEFMDWMEQFETWLKWSQRAIAGG